MTRQSQTHAGGVLLFAVLVFTIGRPGDARAQEPAEGRGAGACDRRAVTRPVPAVNIPQQVGNYLVKPRPVVTVPPADALHCVTWRLAPDLLSRSSGRASCAI